MITADITKTLFANTTIGNECWNFVGGRTGSGYGAIWSEGRNLSTHRLSYELYNGPIPKGMFVLHKCDNPACINPEHLFCGFHKDNKQDEIQKDRHVYGERVGNHKLSEVEVLEIRELLNNDWTPTQLARRYKVTSQAISLIKNGRNWSWL